MFIIGILTIHQRKVNSMYEIIKLNQGNQSMKKVSTISI